VRENYLTQLIINQKTKKMKKNFLNFAVMFFAVIALNACKSSNSPEAVAEKYLNHIAKQEWAEAKKLGTENTQQLVDMLASFGGKSEIKEVKIEGMKCDVKGDSALCNYKSNNEADKLNLIKKDGKWLVDQKKEMPADNGLGKDSTSVKDQAATDKTETD